MISGVSSQSVSDVFSSTYQNYVCSLNVDLSAASEVLLVRMRVAGADNSSANYVWEKASASSADTVNASSSGTGSAATSFNVASLSGTHTSFSNIQFFRPFETDNTGFYAESHFFNSLSNHATTFAGGSTTVTTSYTGFTLIPNSGTMTGTIRVYGLAN
jgi:hypothetical protein